MTTEPEQPQDTTHNDAPLAASEEKASTPAKYHAEFSPPTHDRRQFTVFQVDDFAFHPTPTKTAHWAVPWSDLMMTMFILFLIMFVYQTEHKKLMVSAETEVVGGQTTGALDVVAENKPSASFAPIKPGLPLITAGTIKKVVPIHIEDIDVNTRFFNDGKENQMERIKKSVEKPSPPMKKGEEKSSLPAEPPAAKEAELLTDQGPSRPSLLSLEQAAAGSEEKNKKLYETLSNTLTRYNLDRYASVQLIQGTGVHITLSSDLFFTADKAELTPKSMTPLQKIGASLKETPFMIEIIGHTDNQSMRSNAFPSNWELSAARASAMARYFIEETDMAPNQFAVSGFSSYRPLYPNTTAQNRAANRRIEVIISNKYPQSVMADKNQ
jgi:chemotaxis protein MotB